MDKSQLCESLMIWLQTFSIDGPRTSVEELADGIAMSQVLNQIAPRFFTTTWMSKIKSDVGSNWRLKVNNLKKIHKGIVDYYTEELGQQIHDSLMPEVNSIGEHNDRGELGRLLQLILGCAVNCDTKELYIQRIMALEEAVQHVVMTAIQELMTKEAPHNTSETDNDVSDQLKRTMEELNSVLEQKEEISQRCHELDLQVATLQEEKASLVSEIDRLHDRLTQADSLEDPSTPAGRRYQQLQTQVDQQQEELYRIETARDDMKIKVEIQEKELFDTQQKNEELTQLADAARQMKDELDILRHTSDKVSKYEQTIETYKKKLEELSDLKGQLKILEEKNTGYMQSNMELEEEVRKAQTYKTQLDVYKRQAQELQLKTADETKRADKAEFEGRRHQEKLQATLREKERLTEERDSLRDLNEELQCSQSQPVAFVDSLRVECEAQTQPSVTAVKDSSPDSLDYGGDLAFLTLPQEIKERIIRLQHENKILKLQKSATSEEETQILQTELEDSKARTSELESEVRILNQRVLELDARIEDLQESQTKSPVTDSASSTEMKQTVTTLRAQKEAMECDLAKYKQTVEDLENKINGYEHQKKEMSDQLKKKTDEMKVMEERYRKYLDKARNVIKSLEPKQSSSSHSDIHTLKSQVNERDKLIEHLEKDHEKTKEIREQEEKLIVSAWYNLGMLVNRKGMEERLSNGASGQSFLARQRQTHTRRNQSIISPHAAGSR